MKNTRTPITFADIAKNGIWLTLPPLLFGLSLMGRLPAALTPARFNDGLPDILATGENISRIVVFAMPALFSIGLTTRIQKRGLALYVAGVALYYLSYAALIFFPESAWSTSLIGFVATAYSTVFWLVGLALLGEKFYLPKGLRYRPAFYAAPVASFLGFHITHAVIVFQRSV